MKHLLLSMLLVPSLLYGAQQTINVGTTANDGTGDSLRTAFGKTNSNFTELYNANSAARSVATGGTGQTSYTNGQILIGNTTGNTLAKGTITGTAAELTVTNGAGSITLSLPSALTFTGKTITGGTYTNIVVMGTLDASGATTTFGPIASLGTPGAGVLTNCTGLPISTGVSGLGTGVATFLGTPSGANLASALTSALPESKGGTGVTNLTSSALATLVGDGTGTGPSVFGTNPTFTSRIDLGSNGTAAGSLFINGSTSGYANLIPSSATMGNRTIQLPAADGVIALVGGGLGAATATTINKVALTAPASGSTLTIADGKTLTVSQDVTLNRQSSTGLPVEFCVACSDETTTITTGTAKVTMRAPYAFTVTSVRASVNTVSSSGLPTVDINEAGTTILSTKLTIDASEFTSVTAATAPVISDTAIADDAELTFDVDVAGTGAKGLKVWIYGYR